MTEPFCSKDLLKFGALVAGGAAVGYLIGTIIGGRSGKINPMIRLDCDKVVDSICIDDIERKKNGQMRSFCRCWKSSTWPYCDGVHKQHNRETGDNVGPIRIVDNSVVIH